MSEWTNAEFNDVWWVILFVRSSDTDTHQSLRFAGGVSYWERDIVIAWHTQASKGDLGNRFCSLAVDLTLSRGQDVVTQVHMLKGRVWILALPYFKVRCAQSVHLICCRFQSNFALQRYWLKV